MWQGQPQNADTSSTTVECVASSYTLLLAEQRSKVRSRRVNFSLGQLLYTEKKLWNDNNTYNKMVLLVICYWILYWYTVNQAILKPWRLLHTRHTSTHTHTPFSLSQSLTHTHQHIHVQHIHVQHTHTHTNTRTCTYCTHTHTHNTPHYWVY